MSICMRYVFLAAFIALMSSCDTDSRTDVLDATALDSSSAVVYFPNDYVVCEHHYHSVEFHHDCIYAMYERDIPYDSTGYSRALWCFSPYNEPKLITESRSIDFRVSPGNDLIAVDKYGVIEVLDTTGELLHAFDIDTLSTGIVIEDPYDLSDLSLNLVGWNSDGDRLWCSLMWTYVTHAYVSIDVRTWEIELFDDFIFDTAEYVLNPNTGWVAYSDYPITFSVDERDLYHSTGAITTLYARNLFTNEVIELDSAVTNLFHPEWHDPSYHEDNIIHYRIGDEPFSFSI